jgi:hypothetical protein
MNDVSELLGKTLTKIQNYHDQLYFYVNDGSIYKLYHNQSCCENVYIEDVCGELDDLVGSPITMSEEVDSNYSNNELEEFSASFTWTFYKFATVKGYVTVRWFGSSNGYYSERVDFEKVE